MRNKDINFHNFKALTKKMTKLEAKYEAAEGKPALMAKIEKQALSVQKRLDEFGKEG